MPCSPLKLQAKPNFQYTFKNIILLYEALTHSYDKCNSLRILADGIVKYRKKTFYRLKTLGGSVLKLILSEQALCQNEFTAGPGKLTKAREALMGEDVLRLIGKELELHNFIEVQKGFNYSPMEKLLSFSYWRSPIENLYPDVIKAILGAVYVDSGCNNTSLSVIRDLLARWYPNWNNMPVKVCFCTVKLQYAVHLISEDYSQQNKLVTLSKDIGYQFETRRFLLEALTHGSFKQGFGLRDAPDYERLEFLGDTVYELIICEYLFWYYVNDDVGRQFNRKELEKYTSEPFQQVLAEHLSLSKYLLKPSHVEVKRIHEFIESLIGAVYVDSWDPVTTTRRMLINLVNNCSPTKLFMVGCSKLPYSITTHYPTLQCALQKPSSSSENQFSPSPKILHQFEFLNLCAFMKQWQFFTASSESHTAHCEEAMNAAKLKKKTMPLVEANQLEYNRMNLYGFAVQKVFVMDYNLKCRHGHSGIIRYADDGTEVLIVPDLDDSLLLKMQELPEDQIVPESKSFQPECNSPEEEINGKLGENQQGSWGESGFFFGLWSFFWKLCWYLGGWVVHLVHLALSLFVIITILQFAFSNFKSDGDVVSNIGMHRQTSQ